MKRAYPGRLKVGGLAAPPVRFFLGHIYLKVYTFTGNIPLEFLCLEHRVSTTESLRPPEEINGGRRVD